MRLSEEFKLRAKGYRICNGEMPDISESAQPGVVYDDGEVILPHTKHAHQIDWSRVVGYKLHTWTTYHQPQT